MKPAGKRCLAMVAALFCTLIGCAPDRAEKLPRYPRATPAEAARVIRERYQATRTVSATGQLTLSRAEGQSVRLDAAVATQGADHVRLRAWKLGRAVFDLTSTPEGVFLYTAEDPSIQEKVQKSGLDAAELARTLQLFGGGFFDRAGLDGERAGEVLVFTRRQDATALVCTVDGDTLTPRRFSLMDSEGKSRFTLEMSRYVDHGGLAYPHRYVARSEQGTVKIDLREVELNTDLPPAAFKAPRRAEKLP